MKKYLLIILSVIVVGGITFYGGMKYGQSKSSQVNNSRNFQQMGNFNAIQRGGSQQGNGFVSGDIISKDNNSITIKLRDGGSKIILFSDTTKIMKSTDGLASDLITGEQVSVNGTANQDGSITAQSIQLRPAMPGTPQ